MGFYFCLSLFSEELVALTTRFTDELMNQGLTKRILTLVSEINVTREFERLQKERGLGNEKHRKEVGACCLILFFIVFAYEASDVIETYKWCGRIR